MGPWFDARWSFVINIFVLICSIAGSGTIVWQERLNATAISHSVINVVYECLNSSNCATTYDRSVVAEIASSGDEQSTAQRNCTFAASDGRSDSQPKYRPFYHGTHARILYIDRGRLVFRKIISDLFPHTYYRLTLRHMIPPDMLGKLQPNKIVELLQYDSDHKLTTDVKTFMIPGCLQIRDIEAFSVRVVWQSFIVPELERPFQLIFIYALVESVPARSSVMAEDDIYNLYETGDKRVRHISWSYLPNTNKERCPTNEDDDRTVCKEIVGLRPNTSYSYALIAEYKLSHDLFNIMNRPHCTGSCTVKDQLLYGMLVTKAALSSMPRGLKVESTDDESLTVSWVEPAQLGGSLISYYFIEWKRADIKDWSSVNVTETNWVLPTESRCHECKMDFRVAAVNGLGLGNVTNTVSYSVRSNTSTVQKIARIGVPPMLLALLLLAIVVAYLIYRRKQTRRDSNLPAHKNPIIILPKDLQELQQVTLQDITLVKQLGEGYFGKVYEGFVSNLNTEGAKAIRVAFKTLTSSATDDQKDELIREALTMRNLHHRNIVQLVGLCVDDGEFWLILELMNGGDLLSGLRFWGPRDNMPSQATLSDLTRIIHNLAQGCAYLGSFGYVHRDLAARNCLVSCMDPSVCSVKIADFGLTRGIYDKIYYKLTETSILPLRWTAPEVLHTFKFSHGSDIWSFGILVWEIMTLGDHPYDRMADDEVIDYVKSGNTLSCPVECPKNVYNAFSCCWAYDPSLRCSFRDIVDAFLVITQNSSSIEDRPYMRAKDELEEPDGTSLSSCVSGPQNERLTSVHVLPIPFFDNPGFQDYSSGTPLLTGHVADTVL